MKSIKIVTIILIIIMQITIIVKPIYASGINPDDYKPSSTDTVKDADKLKDFGNKIINAVSTIGIIVSTLTFTALGIKYMLGSVEEKSEYKKGLEKYLIGTVIIFGISLILRFISEVAGNIQ